MPARLSIRDNTTMSLRTIRKVNTVFSRGVPELNNSMVHDLISVSRAEEIARMSARYQRWALNYALDQA